MTWISVTDSLPDGGAKVWVFRSFEVQEGFYTCVPSENSAYVRCGFEQFAIYRADQSPITYWMNWCEEKPNPPTEEE